MTAMILWAKNSMVYDITPWTFKKKSSIFNSSSTALFSSCPQVKCGHYAALQLTFEHLQSKTFDHFVA